MSETSREKVRINGQGIVDLIGTLWPIRQEQWQITAEEDTSKERLAEAMGECVVLGQKFSPRKLSPKAKTAMRKRGEIVAHLEYLECQYYLTLAQTEERLITALNPEGETPAMLRMVPRGEAQDAFGGLFVPPTQEVNGTFAGLNAIGNMWVDDVGGHVYQVRIFNDELTQQVDIEVTYPEPA